MNTQKLTILSEAVTLGSLRKAADALGYSQPALSLMIDSLEEETGMRLVYRDKTGVKLNEAGRALYPYMRSILESEAAFWNKVSEMNGREKISIGTFTSYAETWLPEVIREFNLDHPDVDVDVLLGTGKQRDWIDNNTVDFGIMDTDLAGSLDTIRLAEDTYYIMLPSDAPELNTNGPVDINLIVQKYPILQTRHDPNCALSHFIERYECKRIIRMRAASASAIERMIEAHVGIAFFALPEMYELTEKVKLVPTEPALKRTICIACKNRSALSPIAISFAEYIKSYWDDYNKSRKQK